MTRQVTRDDLLKFALELSRDGYTREHSRLALIETKAQLIAVTVGIFATLFLALGPEHLSHGTALDGVFSLGILLSLGISLVLSLAASMIASVRAPPSTQVIADCERLLGRVGDVTATLDTGAAETVLGNMSAAYQLATDEVSSLLTDRTGKLQGAQLALLVAVLLTTVWLGLPAVGSAIALFNK